MLFDKNDWFSYTHFDGVVSDFSALREGCRQQITNHLQRELKRLEPRKMETLHKILNVDVRLDETRLNEYLQFRQSRLPQDTTCKVANNNAEEMSLQPTFLTFHGTSSPAAINSIMNYGFLMPGQQHPRHGYSLHMRVGNAYGNGVYTSSSVEFAAGYAAEGSDGTIQLIVSACSPGNVGHLTSEPAGLPPYRFGVKADTLEVASCLLTPLIETGCYYNCHNVNTVTPDFHTMWICGDTRQLLPLAVVTLCVNGVESVERVHRQLCAKPQPAEPRKEGADEEDDLLYQKRTGRPRITMYQLWGNYYGFPDHVYHAQSRSAHIRPHYVLPQAVFFDKAFVASIIHRSSELQDETTTQAHIYDDKHSQTVFIKQIVQQPSQFAVRARSYHLLHGMRSALEAVVKEEQEAAQRGSLPTYHVIHIVVERQMVFAEADLESLLNEFRFLSDRFYVNIKVLIAPQAGWSVHATEADVMGLKQFQAEGIFEQYQLYTAQIGGWSAAWSVIEEELTNIGSHNSSETYLGDFRCRGVKIECGECFYGEGIVVGVDATPVWQGTFHHPVVFQGQPPKQMNIDGRAHDVVIQPLLRAGQQLQRAINKERVKGEDVDSSSIMRWRRQMHPLEPVDMLEEPDHIKARCRQNVIRGLRLLVGLLSTFRNRVVRSRDKVRTYLGEIELIAFGVLFVARDPCMACSETGTLTSTVAQLLSELSTLASLPFTGTLFNTFQQMRFGRRLMGRIQVEASETLKDVTEWRAMTALRMGTWSTHTTGIPIRVLRSDAGAVNPWAVVVPFVSSEVSRHLVSQAFFAASTEDFIWDAEHHNLATDVLVLRSEAFGDDAAENDKAAALKSRDLTPSQALACYQAFIFTRNPLLQLKQQHIALRTVTWVRCLESVLLRHRLSMRDAPAMVVGSVAPVADMVATALTIMDDIVMYFNKVDVSVDWMSTLQSHSLCQILGIEAARVHTWREQHRHENAQVGGTPPTVPLDTIKLRFNLLGESLTRTCMSFANGTKRNSEELLMWLFGLDEDRLAGLGGSLATHTTTSSPSATTVLPAVESLVDVQRCLGRSQRIIRVSHTNCTPFAVVACLGVLDLAHRGASIAEILHAYETQEISMAKFFEHFCRAMTSGDGSNSVSTAAWTTSMTQLSLFVYALSSCKLGTSRKPFLDVIANNGGDCSSYVSKTIVDLCVSVFQRRERRSAAALANADRRQLRAAQRLEEAQPFIRYHNTVPRTFTEQEVAHMEHDRSRLNPDDVPLTLLPSGLLAHHCCYPDCPEFLKPCMTIKDVEALRKGKLRRHGMQQHLQLDSLVGNYCPSFHKHGLRLAKMFIKPMNSGEAEEKQFNAFVAAMEKQFAHVEGFVHMRDRNVVLKHFWEDVKRIGEQR